ncbi:hypothetical protein M8J77_025781 [Diaphorina citri]|nr:hypothetical protein M8J77_025781 [Diaphorina citri]
MEIIVPTSLLGQYEMLGEFVKLIGVEHRNKFGEYIFYTDVGTGEYLTENQIMNNRKHPHRILPFIIWTPSFIDPSDMEYFVIFYFAEMYMILLLQLVVFETVVMETIVPTSLLGQYEMLGEFVKLIGVEHRNKFGEYIFYTDVGTGEYLTENQIMNNGDHENLPTRRKKDLAKKLKQWRTLIYPSFYLTQIMRRYQGLNQVMSKYMSLLEAVFDILILIMPYLISWILTFYQIAYMKHLPKSNCFKIVIEFLSNCFGAFNVIELFDLQEKLFKVSNRNIYKKCILKEYTLLITALLFTILVSMGYIIETLLPASERTLWLMSSLYHSKHPHRILPIIIWTPSSIDVTDDHYFVPFYLIELYATLLLHMATFEAAVLQTIVPTSLLGQYEMLGEFVKLIGVEHRDYFGEHIFYFDIAAGRYLTETQILNRASERQHTRVENMEVKLKYWRTLIYPRFYSTQVVRRYQVLNQVMNKYIQLQETVMNITVLPFLMVWFLSFYQIACMKHLPKSNCIKIVVEFFSVFLGAYFIISQVDKLNTCNEIIAQAIYQSGWYNCTPQERKKICVFLKNAQEEREIRVLGGVIKANRPQFLNMIHTAFSFLNFMKVTGRL